MAGEVCGGMMKLRWKHFLVLVAVSLVPLLTVAWISQNASRRLGKSISSKARNTLTEKVTQEMVRTTRSYAMVSLMGGQTVEFALRLLAAEAELALALPPPSPTKIFYAADFDDPASAPDDIETSALHPVRSDKGIESYKLISRQHPNFLLAPGTEEEKVAGDISRFTRLAPVFTDISKRYGEGIHWAYVSLENGLHIAYPGHGGYPSGFDPRKRPWYKSALESQTVTWLPVVDTTTGQLLLTVSIPFKRPDGSVAGVAGLDIKITHALLDSETTSRWSENMSSFIISIKPNPGTQKPDIWVISSGEKQSAPAAWLVGEESSQRAEFEHFFQQTKDSQSGYFDMPYMGVESLWAYAAMFADRYFVLVVPKSEILTLPEEVGRMFLGYTKEQTAITGIAVLFALCLVGIVAFFTSRYNTRHMLDIIGAWKRLARGDFSVRLKASVKDERAQLVHAFNEIVPKIQEHMQMSKALDLAQEVQQGLLPQSDPYLPGFDIAGASIYCDETGGDYYDFLTTKREGKDALAVVVGDVSGHGVSAALFMATARAQIRLRSSMPGEAASIITDVNRHLSQDTAQTGDFMTLFYCELTEGEMEARWVRAGHDPALLYDPSADAFEELVGEGTALGLDKSFAYHSMGRSLGPGQILIIGTDGIWEMRNKAGDMFGKETLMEIVRRHQTESARQMVDAVTRALEQFREDLAPEDDVTLVAIKVGP